MHYSLCSGFGDGMGMERKFHGVRRGYNGSSLGNGSETEWGWVVMETIKYVWTGGIGAISVPVHVFT